MLPSWNSSNVNVFMDISTYCNAGCPQCHRTNPNGLGKADWLPLVQWSIDQFKTAFPLKTMQRINCFYFCGTFGDPIMVKDFIEITEYIIENSNAFISVDTNGSIRDEDFWWNLSIVGGRRLTVRFAVDGINQEMHQHYRRFTNLSKVLNHMKVAAQTKCNVSVQTVLFKHNEDYKDEIRNLCKEYGATRHTFVNSDRFSDGEYITEHTDENGKEFILEKAGSNNIRPKTKLTSNIEYDIKCAWAKPRNEVVISFDGQVLPCCYHQNNYTMKKNKFIEKSPIYKEYEDNKLEYNVFHTPLHNIIDSKWWSKSLVDSITNDPIETCIRNCNNKKGELLGRALAMKREHL